MAICKQCGKSPIYWPQKFDNKGTHRPVEFLATGLQIIENIVQPAPVNIYQVHVCDPDDMLAYEGTAKQNRELHEAYEEQRKAAGADALTRPCKKCGAKIGEACANLNSRKKGEVVKTRWPHPERMTDAVDDKEVS